MDKCLQPHAHHCRPISWNIEFIDFLKLFLRFLTKHVTICGLMVAISRLKVRQSSVIFQEEMMTYMSHWLVKFTIFSVKDWSCPFHHRKLVAKKMWTSHIDCCEACYAGTEFTNSVPGQAAATFSPVLAKTTVSTCSAIGQSDSTRPAGISFPSTMVLQAGTPRALSLRAYLTLCWRNNLSTCSTTMNKSILSRYTDLP